MRVMRGIFIGLAALAAACTGGNEARQAGAPAMGGKSLAPVADAALTPAELGLFRPLPARTDRDGQPATEAQIALGRTLYYETVLSQGHDVSCNSCHPLNGYGADGRRVSFGHKGQQGSRNAPTVYNAAAQVAQFWDGRAPDVEAQAKGPILNPAEMGMPDSAAVLAHLRGSASYRAAFAAAFPGEASPVTYDNVGRAIGAFERGLMTPSRWDAYLHGDSSALTGQERRGAKTFVAAGCTACHAGALAGGQMFQKAGAAAPWPSAADSGRYAVTHRASDLFVFKVPTLRNVEMTGPYFSDGSVASLDSAIAMMGRYQLGLTLTTPQIADIHAWLRTLT
ncbi:MAG: c-type cytochrome, partial [Gemmatimonadota bacterium]|nr:c-type cytochrome [Gemmatimonadota bacterium]